jgi:YHS domain-containing protein
MKYLATFIIIISAACNQPAEKQKKQTMIPVPVVKDSSKAVLNALAFDSKTDLVCGMPLRAGVEDTLRYKGKLYGFCAKECKEEFLNDPNSI